MNAHCNRDQHLAVVREKLVRLENCNWLLILCPPPALSYLKKNVSDAFDIYKKIQSTDGLHFFALILNDIIGGMFMNGGFKKIGDDSE